MNRGKKIPEQLLVFTGVLIFFLSTLAANFSGPHDSIAYLNGIVSGKHLFHPHHLIYHFVSHYWLEIIKPVFPFIKDYYLVEVFTALWGSGTMTIVYSFFRNRFNMSMVASVISTTVVAFSFGPWFYSVNIEVYAPPMFLLMLALYILTKNDFQKSDVWKVCLLNILAILFHQVHILFAVVILYKFWRERKTIPFLSSLMQYAVMGIVLVGGAYFLVGWVIEGNNSIASWTSWMQGYATEDSAYWKPINTKLPLLIATGYSHAFIGGHFVFRLPVVEKYLLSSLSSHNLGDEIFLARHITHSMAIFLTILSVVLAILMGWLTIRFIRHYRTITNTAGKVITPLMIVGFVYSAFFCFWMPEILEFWIFQTVLVWLLLLGSLQYGGKGLPAFQGWRTFRPALLVAMISACLFIINFFGSIRWLLDLRYDQYYVKIEKVKDTVTEKDLILLQDAWQLKDFLTYFTNAQVFEAPEVDSLRPATDKAIDDCLANGGRIFVYPEASHQPHNTRYIDSLMTIYKDRRQVFPESTARIWLINK